MTDSACYMTTRLAQPRMIVHANSRLEPSRSIVAVTGSWNWLPTHLQFKRGSATLWRQADLRAPRLEEEILP